MLATQLKLLGMAQAVDTTEQLCPNWAHQAYNKLVEFCDYFGYEYIFITETFREWAHNHGLPKPMHDRAFGQIMHRAAKQGLLQKVGFGKTSNPKSHAAYSTLWQVK